MKLLQNNTKINTVFFLLILSLLVPIFTLPKEFLNLRLNTFHSPFLDIFLKNITHFGDGLLYVPLCFIAFLINRKMGVGFFFLFLIQTFISIVFKQFLFPSAPRPALYLQKTMHLLYKVEGVEIHNIGSFPSGHTMTAFAIAFYFYLNFTISPIIKFGLFFIATLVAISRVYLLQHFYIDVVFGFYFGFIAAILSTLLYQKKIKKQIII